MRGHTQVNFRLPNDVVDSLRTIAEVNGCSLTEQINRALQDGLEKLGGQVKTQIRLPAGLHRGLVEQAKKHHRSFNSEMVIRLQSSFGGTE